MNSQTNKQTTIKMKVLGFTDSKTECECGKQGLKGVYVVETSEGEILNLGSSCVKKKWGLTQKQFTSKVKDGYNVNLSLANAEYEKSKSYISDNDNDKELELDSIRLRYNIEYKHLNRMYRAFYI